LVFQLPPDLRLLLAGDLSLCIQILLLPGQAPLFRTMLWCLLPGLTPPWRSLLLLLR